MNTISIDINSPFLPSIGQFSNQLSNNIFANIRQITPSNQTNHIIHPTLCLNQDNKGNQITPVSYDQYLAMVNTINSAETTSAHNQGYIFSSPTYRQGITFLSPSNLITSQSHQINHNVMKTLSQQKPSNVISNSSIMEKIKIQDSSILPFSLSLSSSPSNSTSSTLPINIIHPKCNEKKSIKQKIVDLTQNSKQKNVRGSNILVKGRNGKVVKGRSSKNCKSQSSRQNRIAHNEMEKNRRANLRGHLEMLRTVVPSATISSRDTTLALLTRANNHLKTIKENKIKMMEQKEKLLARNQELKTKIAHLKSKINTRKNKTVSYISNISSLSTTTTTLSIAGSTSSTSSPIMSYHSMIFNLNKTTKSPTKQYPEVSQTNIIVNKQYSYDPYNDGLIAALPLTYPYNNGAMPVS
ncbi:Myc-type, basic helix-loop-helix (bHLH) domain-containing protein [Strongyloides ratti]|uniref:Myc-type, basic helix-loop-helix (BHLH) domain-containing protein n=1 Tax=Strongyloides ratti TaxID=34506 RepID=A0A090N0S9_STRRB|nr:Myc-type, basic helix-loop-helix (bHLH) domain-containing protein [Strongyloides ratti]CEF71218.1 Myc-type, basic helix-loop-helix (bHLH) domain-containing protein [Strongyloides ratti]